MSDTLLFALPAAPDPERRDTHWWHVVDGHIVAAGAGEGWLARSGSDRDRVALAPAGQVRLSFSDSPSTAATSRQAAAVARVAAVESSLGDDGTLHAVSSVADDGRVVTAVVDKETMLAWLDWARELGAEPNHVVPVGALLPLSDRWTAATIGAEDIAGRIDAVMPNEPDLAAFVIGDADVDTLDEWQVRKMLERAAETPPLDLRTGRFARRRRIVVERERIRELAIIAALIPLITFVLALVDIFKLERASGRLDSETLAVAQAALGHPVTLETAESELAQRVGGSAYGGVMNPLAALYQAIQPEPSVSSTSVTYAPDGTLSVTLAAPTVDAVNRALIALQRNGYKVTAVPRQSPDGRSMVDVTVRSGP